MYVLSAFNVKCLYVVFVVTFIELHTPPPLPVSQPPPRGYQYSPHQGSLPPNQSPGIIYNHGRSEYRDVNSWIGDSNSCYNQGKHLFCLALVFPAVRSVLTRCCSYFFPKILFECEMYSVFS